MFGIKGLELNIWKKNDRKKMFGIKYLEQLV